MPRSLAASLDEIARALSHITGQNDQPAKRLAAVLQARLVHGDIQEIFRGGLHEYLTEFLESTQDLSVHIQRSFFASTMVE